MLDLYNTWKKDNFAYGVFLKYHSLRLRSGQCSQANIAGVSDQIINVENNNTSANSSNSVDEEKIFQFIYLS